MRGPAPAGPQVGGLLAVEEPERLAPPMRAHLVGVEPDLERVPRSPRRPTWRARRTGRRSANSTWPGGTSAISAWRSDGAHHAVSKNRFGCAGASRQIHERSEIPAWARIRRIPG